MIIDDTAMIQGAWFSIGIIAGFFGSVWLARRMRKWEKENWRESFE